MPTKYQIGTFWAGSRLSFLELLCLSSFVEAGHKVVVHSFDPIENLPFGVNAADASLIIQDRATIPKNPTALSNLFRCKLLACQPNMVWAAPNMYCVKTLQPEDGHFYAWESPHHIGADIFALPEHSGTLSAIKSFAFNGNVDGEDTGSNPDGISPSNVEKDPRKMQAAHDVGATGLTHLLHKSDEIKFALPREAIYPISFNNVDALLAASSMAETYLTADTYAIKLHSQRVHRLLRSSNGIPEPTSFIGRLLARHNIDPKTAPFQTNTVQAKPIPPTEKRGRGVVNLTDIADKYGSDQGSSRHRFTELYQMLFLPKREQNLTLALVGLDGGIGLNDKELWAEKSQQTLKMWRDYFPNADILAFDRPQSLSAPIDGVTYHSVTLEDAQDLAARCHLTPDIVIDDATHASHHQQTALRALFPKLANGGLYVIEDLRSQPASLERQGLVKTAALFQDYLEHGVFQHPDAEMEDALNELRVDISGCFVFQAKFQKHRRDQVLVLNKR